jgi:hypothetical protein
MRILSTCFHAARNGLPLALRCAYIVYFNDCVFAWEDYCEFELDGIFKCCGGCCGG